MSTLWRWGGAEGKRRERKREEKGFSRRSQKSRRRGGGRFQEQREVQERVKTDRSIRASADCSVEARADTSTNRVRGRGGER